MSILQKWTPRAIQASLCLRSHLVTIFRWIPQQKGTKSAKQKCRASSSSTSAIPSWRSLLSMQVTGGCLDRERGRMEASLERPLNKTSSVFFYSPNPHFITAAEHPRYKSRGSSPSSNAHPVYFVGKEKVTKPLSNKDLHESFRTCLHSGSRCSLSFLPEAFRKGSLAIVHTEGKERKLQRSLDDKIPCAYLPSFPLPIRTLRISVPRFDWKVNYRHEPGVAGWDANGNS